jgi:CheY-like chemotaxis protein
MLPTLNEAQHPDLDRGGTLEGLRILAVDDNDDTLELLALILEGYGAQVITARSASAALNLIKQQSFDVLVSDLAMPEKDGYWLIRQVRNLPPEKSGLIDAIALTAIAGEVERNNSVKAGFNIHLTKPIEPNKLVVVVNQLVAHRQYLNK